VIAFNQRTLVLGKTRSGKSELLNAQFSQLRCQKVVYDSKSEWTVRGVQAAEHADSIDWRQPVIHFVPGEDVRDDAEAFFRMAFRRPNPLVVCVHELADLCEYRAQATPAPVHRYIRQGGAHGKGLLAASQRPVEMPVSARSEPEHVFLFVPGLQRDDMEAVAAMMHLSVNELDAAVARLMSELGAYSFLYYQRDSGELRFCPPLPAHVRSKSTITRRPGVT
jgi:hypothetical protein